MNLTSTRPLFRAALRGLLFAVGIASLQSSAQSVGGLPVGKQQIQDFYNSERSLGSSNPAPRDPSAVPVAAPAPNFVVGIEEGCDGPFPAQHIRVVSCWRGIQNGEFVFVYAGTLSADVDPLQSVVFTVRMGTESGASTVGRFISPARAGRIHVIYEQGGVLVLSGEDVKSTLRFDSASSSFVSIKLNPARGDLNGDGSVDTTDLQIIQSSLNTLAYGPGDPRDLNGDGKIDALDLRILTTLCTKPRCAI